MRQENDTTCLWGLAGDPCRPLTECDPQAIAQRFHHTRGCEARPSRALLGMLLRPRPPSRDTRLQRPPLGGGGLGIRMTARRLLARLAHRGLQRRIGRRECTRARLLPLLILAAGVHHHGSIGLAVEGDTALGHCITGPWPAPCWWRLRAPPHLCPVVAGHRLRMWRRRTRAGWRASG